MKPDAASCDLSIVIVSWNTRELLDDCLASLPAAADGLVYETLVIDNDSADGSAAMVREKHPDALLIESGGNLGFVRGNNLAFPETRGDHVLLLNPDTVCPPGSLTRLTDFARTRPRLGAVGPTLVDADGEPTITYGCFPHERYHWLELLGSHRTRRPRAWRRFSFTKVPPRGAPSARVDYVAGACMLIPRPVLETVGFLDERFFMYFEETDWSRRALAAGWEIWHHAEVDVTHLEGRAAARASRFSLVQFHRSYRLFVAKHHGRMRGWSFRLALFAENAAKALARGLLALIKKEGRARNAALASDFLFVAGLQLRRRLDAPPPR